MLPTRRRGQGDRKVVCCKAGHSIDARKRRVSWRRFSPKVRRNNSLCPKRNLRSEPARGQNGSGIESKASVCGGVLPRVRQIRPAERRNLPPASWGDSLYFPHSSSRPGRLYSLPGNEIRPRRRGRRRAFGGPAAGGTKEWVFAFSRSALGLSLAAARASAAGHQPCSAPHLGQQTDEARRKHGQSPRQPA